MQEYQRAAERVGVGASALLPSPPCAEVISLCAKNGWIRASTNLTWASTASMPVPFFIAFPTAPAPTYSMRSSIAVLSAGRRVAGVMLLAATLAVFTAHAAGNDGTAQALRIGFVPGPYADEFKAGVEPQLRKKGYTVRYVEFSTGLEANQAVYRGEIDADVMQHEVYLKSYNERTGTDLVGVVQVPTPPMGLYSNQHHSLADVKAGARVAVPNDPVNLERALKILQRIGWIRIRPNPNPVDVTERDVIANPAGIRIVPLESAQAPRALDDVDYAAIQGNFAIFSGHKLTDALALEEMTPPYINQVVVRAGKRADRATQDIVQAYQSPAFQQAIRDNHFYDGFRLPAYFENRTR